MAIDQMPLCDENREEVELATKRTHDWAKKCLESRRDKKQLLFGICQGGIYEDLRRESAKYISSLDFDGIAIGGLAIGESLKNMNEMVDVALKEIPENKPRYLMGVGSPRELIDFVEKGIDIFDSVWPTRLARHATALTHEGNVSIEKGRYKKQMISLDEKCDCRVCKTYTRSYLSHLFRTKEPLGPKLLSYHNVYFIQKLIEKMRKAIKENKWEELKNEYRRV